MALCSDLSEAFFNSLIYFLKNMDIQGAVADDGTVQTDETTGATDSTTGDMTLLSLVPVVGDAYYFGMPFQCNTLVLNVSQAGVGSWTITWEYWNGAWVALSGVTDGTTGFTVSGTNDVTFTLPTDWVRSTLSPTLPTSKDITSCWIRARVTAYASLTTQPLGAQAWYRPIYNTRVYLKQPDLNLTQLTLPFVVITHYDTSDDFWTQPDIAYRTAVDPNWDSTIQTFESRNVRYLFTIGVYCTSFAQQRHLPHLVKRQIESKWTLESGLNKDGFQVWKGFTSGSPDSGTELCIAEPIMGGPYPLGGETEEDEVRKWRSMIDCYWEVARDKSKVFISTDT